MEAVRFFLMLAVVLAAYLGFDHFRERWRSRYTGLKAVAVRLDPNTREWTPIMRGGRRLETDVGGWTDTTALLDHFGWEASKEEGEVAIQQWGRRKIYISWFSSRSTGTGPEQWTGKWVSIPTRGFGRP